jgi:hypothetical protein
MISDKKGDLKICILTPTCLSFLCSSEYKVFNIDMRVYGIHRCQYLDFFVIFLKPVNMILKLFKTMGSLLLRSEKTLFGTNIYCLLNSPPYVTALHQNILACSWLKQSNVLNFVAKLDVKGLLDILATN